MIGFFWVQIVFNFYDASWFKVFKLVFAQLFVCLGILAPTFRMLLQNTSYLDHVINLLVKKKLGFGPS
jgi:hypothetical protein